MKDILLHPRSDFDRIEVALRPLFQRLGLDASINEWKLFLKEAERFERYDLPEMAARVTHLRESLQSIAEEYPFLKKVQILTGVEFQKGINPDVLNLALIDFYRRTRNPIMVRSLAEETLAGEIHALYSGLDSAVRSAHREAAKKEADDALSVLGQSMTPDEKSEASEQILTCGIERRKNELGLRRLDPKQLSGLKLAIWQSANECLNLKDETFALSDNDRDFAIEMLLLGAPSIRLGALGGKAAHLLASAATRAAAGRIIQRKLLRRGVIEASEALLPGELRVLGSTYLRELATRSMTFRLTANIGGMLSAALGFELVTDALQGKLLFDQPDWVLRTVWSGITFKAISSFVKSGERALLRRSVEDGTLDPVLLGKYLGKIKSNSIQKLAEYLLVKGHCEAVAMLLVGSIQHGIYSGSVDEVVKNVGRELYKGYVASGALKGTGLIEIVGASTAPSERVLSSRLNQALDRGDVEGARRIARDLGLSSEQRKAAALRWLGNKYRDGKYNSLAALRIQNALELSNEFFADLLIGGLIAPVRGGTNGRLKPGQKTLPPVERTLTLALKADLAKPEFGNGAEANERAKKQRFLDALERLDEYILEWEKGGRNRTLYEYQYEAMKALQAFLERGDRAGFIEMPTGVGKSVIFIELLEALNLRALVLTSRRLLRKQIDGEFKKFAPGLDVGVVRGNRKGLGKQVTVAAYQALPGLLADGSIKPEDYDIVIFDEGHRALGEQTKSLGIERFASSIRIAFTATPDFSLTKGLRHELPVEIYRMSIEEARVRKLIPRIEALLVKTGIAVRGLTKVASREADFSEQDLQKLAKNDARNKLALKVYLEQFPDQPPTIISCIDVDHAKKIAQIFNDGGVKAVAVNGTDTSETELTDIIQPKFASGEIKVIAQADLLLEGFNEKKARILMNLRPSRSWIIPPQRGGRITRLDEDDPNKVSVVVEFVDNFHDGENPPIFYDEVYAGLGVRPHEGASAQWEAARAMYRSAREGTTLDVLTGDSAVASLRARIDSHERFYRLWEQEVVVAKKKEGYVDLREVSKRANTSYGAMLRDAQQIYSYMRTRDGKLLYDLQLIRETNIVNSAFADILVQRWSQIPSKGWNSYESAGRRLGISSGEIEREVRNLQKTNPDILRRQFRWGRLNVNEDSKPILFLSDSLLEIIRTGRGLSYVNVTAARRADSVPSVPPGWVTERAILDRVKDALNLTAETDIASLIRGIGSDLVGDDRGKGIESSMARVFEVASFEGSYQRVKDQRFYLQDKALPVFLDRVRRHLEKQASAAAARKTSQRK